jgi:DNA repair protein RecO (recombination protein O)
MRIELQAAWVLHTRPYRDTSLIADVFTRDHGRLSVIAKGVRSAKSGKSQKNNQRQRLNPFIPVLLSCQGRNELKTLTLIETHGQAHYLTGRVLFSALYVNELLVRLLPVMDTHPGVFDDYQQVLKELNQCDQHDEVDENHLLEVILRRFEFRFLDQMGYGVNFLSEGDTGNRIDPVEHYYFYPDRGFVRGDESGFLGADLLSLGAESYDSPQLRRSAKMITRSALNVLLGGKALKSRELFQQVTR